METVWDVVAELGKFLLVVVNGALEKHVVWQGGTDAVWMEDIGWHGWIDGWLFGAECHDVSMFRENVRENFVMIF